MTQRKLLPKNGPPCIVPRSFSVSSAIAPSVFSPRVLALYFSYFLFNLFSLCRWHRFQTFCLCSARLLMTSSTPFKVDFFDFFHLFFFKFCSLLNLLYLHPLKLDIARGAPRGFTQCNGLPGLLFQQPRREIRRSETSEQFNFVFSSRS